MRALLPASIASLLLACAPEPAPVAAPAAAPAPPPTLASTCPATWAAPPITDPSLVPPGLPLRIVAHAAATGTQNYKCASSASDAGAAFAWSLTGPEATLADCKGVSSGRHFASGGGGPEWEALDKSFVVGKKVAATAAKEPGAVPWLLVEVTKHGAAGGGAAGALSGVTYVQRTTTAGGAAPASGCDGAHADAVVKVPYTADYWFLGR